MLSVKNINTFYGPIQALHDVTLDVNDKEIVSIIGANGAGKTTLMRSIIGLNAPKTGDICFNSKHLESLPTHKIIREGVIYVPEGRKIMGKFTVDDNLELGAFSRNIKGREMERCKEEVFDIFPRLKERRKQLGGTLSGGEQQMLAIGRGLMANPKLLMLDEPSMGLAPIIVEEMFDIIKNISVKHQLPILLVEQNAYIALEISNKCYVLENGRIVMCGTSEELLASDEIKKSYLGG